MKPQVKDEKKRKVPQQSIKRLFRISMDIVTSLAVDISRKEKGYLTLSSDGAIFLEPLLTGILAIESSCASKYEVEFRVRSESPFG